MRFLLTIVAVLAAAPARSAEPAAPTPDAGVVWTGTSSGHRLGWTAQRLFLEQKSGRKVLDGLERPDAEDCDDVTFTSEALSFVGPFFSWYRETSGDCGGAHPLCATTFNVLDLRTQKPADLATVFGKKAVLSALRKDSFVRQVAEEAGADVAKLELAGLELLLREERSLSLSTSSFYFHHLEGDRVAVRVGLTASAHATCGEKVELGLLLPTPANWSAAFARAQSATEGFLRTSRPEPARWGMTVVGKPRPAP